MSGSVYLERGGQELSSRVGKPEMSHSNTLLSDIDETLAEAGLTLEDVDLFSCASGPGSFTGIRIGIATLKGLAATLGKPSIGIPTLHAVAHAAGPSPMTIALLPAGRGEVFAQLFSVSSESVVTEQDTAAHLSPQKLMERYGGLRDVLWAGPGADAHEGLLKEEARHRGFEFASENESGPGWRISAPCGNLAKNVAALARDSYNTEAAYSAESLHAIYVRPSDAELKQQCR